MRSSARAGVAPHIARKNDSTGTHTSVTNTPNTISLVASREPGARLSQIIPNKIAKTYMSVIRAQ